MATAVNLRYGELVRKVLLPFLISLQLATAASATAPQRALAAGSLDSVLETIRAVHDCGLASLKIQSRDGLVLLFVDDDPIRAEAFTCARTWIKANADRLSLNLDY